MEKGVSAFRFLAPIVVLAACLFADTRVVRAQPALTPPNDVLIYLHTDLKNTDFLEPLICALRQVLVANVDAKNITFPLSRDLLASPTQLDVSKLSDQFVRAASGDAKGLTYKYLIIPQDMKDQTFHYVFAASFLSTHDGVVSSARLQVTDPRLTRNQRAELTALRMYKLILKSIALLAGYPNSNRCVLAFPRNLEELDRKPSEFCPNDRAALIAAGVLKEEQSVGCAYVSQRMSGEMISALTEKSKAEQR